MLPPDREREWSNFSGKSKVLITPFETLSCGIDSNRFSQLLAHFIPPYWQNLTKVYVLHTLP